MLNEGAFQMIQDSYERVSGVRPNYRELIAENDGDEEKALKIFAHSYYDVCKIYKSKPIRTNNPIAQLVIDGRIADDEMAAKYDI